ncbi:Flp pilus assembly protein CpaB [Sneathiella marina]|uniref:Flp pilus assembly protein CpaB n=1 Tax=Sneathiella marina TaxID=2950108 RepID=A0ABY4W775_9PROT|nr:Flp pilus assembly protein CpaB [Sneathiella marina]USG63035.1 Flp pilus assembly protein CpaB [Sneathiella marina]
MKSFVLIVFCSIFLGSSAYLLNHYLLLEPAAFDEKPVPLARKSEVLCLMKDGHAGDILTKDRVTWCRSPATADGNRFLSKDATSIADLSNVVLRKFAAKGAFLTRGMFLHPHEKGYLSMLLGKNTRAKSVPVSNIEDYEMVLHHGDHVDLLFTYKNRASDKRAGEVTVKTLLKNVKVLGIKGDYGQGPQGVFSGPEQRRGQLTLALSSRQAELVTVAEQIGTLSILLRSPAGYIHDALNYETDEGVKETDLVGDSSFLNIEDPVTAPSKIRFVRGSNVTFIERPAVSDDILQVGLK